MMWASLVAAEPIPARDTAVLLAPGQWSVGLISPLQVGVGAGLEFDSAVVPWFLLSPNGALRVALRQGDFAVTGEYGLSIPTGAMYLLQGYLFPTWEKSESRVGWFVVPSAGLA